METAESSLKMQKVIGSVTTRRAGFDLHPMVSEEINRIDESKRFAIVMAQHKQGAWTRGENTKNRTITWSYIKQMEPKQLGFLTKAVYDILPKPVNLNLWDLSTSKFCKACGKISGCQYSLRIFTWRHNKILGIIAEITKICCETANKIHV